MISRNHLEWAPGGERLELAGRPIHCGDVLELWIDDRWTPARIEFDPDIGWYAVLNAAGDGRRVHAGDLARWESRRA